MSVDPVLSARGMTHVFRRGRADAVRAVQGVDIDLMREHTVGLVGESGCGKTTLVRCLLRLMEPTAGTLHAGAEDVLTMGREALRGFRRRVQVVFQDPYTSLNPRWPVLAQVAEGPWVHGQRNMVAARRTAAEWLARVGIHENAMERLPSSFSGGERQRIVLARALAVEPTAILLDEPVSSLDLSLRAQVLNLLIDLKAELGLSLLFISHDLEVVRAMSDQVLVMYAGRIVESAPAGQLSEDSLNSHPYTLALRHAVPDPDPDGPLPDPGETSESGPAGSGCAYAPRCPWAEERCREERPELRRLSPEHAVACHRTPLPGEKLRG